MLTHHHTVEGIQKVLDFLKDYAHLINFALFATVIGWLIRISQLSRTSLVDQYQAKLAAKSQEISSLKSELKVQEKQFESQIAVIEHSRTFFERLATMPEDERLKALKLEYEMKIEELERRESNASGAEQKARINTQTERLRQSAKLLRSLDPEKISEIAKLVSMFF